MFNLFLSFALLFYNVSFNNCITKVEKIEYTTNNCENNIINIDLIIKAQVRDIVELKIYFYSSKQELLDKNFYSSALIIEGNKNTRAKIPVDIKGKMFFNIVVYSTNLKKEIENIMFPIYQKESLECDLNINKLCISENPSVIVYQNKKITEMYEQLVLINDELKFKSFNNILPLYKINLITNSKIQEGYNILKLNDKIQEFEIYYKDYYEFNLNVKKDDEVINFELNDRYYIDIINGKMFENYKENAIFSNEILLPYGDKEYEFVIEMYDSFVCFEKVILRFYIEVSGGLIGKCDKSKYCVRRSYL